MLGRHLRARSVALLPLAFVVACVVACGVGSQQGYEPVQPIPFSHAQHAGEFKIDSQYCHYGAERSRHAGVPPLSVCMNCHAQVKKDSPEIQKLAAAALQGPKATPAFSWVKVHRFPDFAWFSHANHVGTGGLKCQGCHGPVETMTRMKQVETMTMGWCLDCHRQTATTSQGKVTPPTDCAACHY